MAYQAAMQGEKLRKGPWHEEEDKLLSTFVTLMGERRWDSIAKASGLKRSGKSCRFRWLNYLRPDLKHGHISMEEEHIILRLHELWGNKWSKIARRLPGRTDNEIKNYWRAHLRKKAQAQHEGNFHCKLNNGEKDFFFQNGEMSGLKYNYENHGTFEDFCGTKDKSFDALGLSNFALTSSPYETRLLDSILELSNDQSEIKHQEGCNSLESCFCYPAWIPDDSNVWDHVGFLWNMD
ncbi:transcription factor MYB27-like [Fagus crenata]